MDPYGGLTEQEWESLPENIAARNRTIWEIRANEANRRANEIRHNSIENALPGIMENQVGIKFNDPRYKIVKDQIRPQVAEQFDAQNDFRELERNIFIEINDSSTYKLKLKL